MEIYLSFFKFADIKIFRMSSFARELIATMSTIFNRWGLIFWRGHFKSSNWNCLNTVPYALSINLRNTTTAGHWRSTVIHVSSERSPGGSLTALTVLLLFSTSECLVESKFWIQFHTDLWICTVYATDIKLSRLRQV